MDILGWLEDNPDVDWLLRLAAFAAVFFFTFAPVMPRYSKGPAQRFRLAYLGAAAAFLLLCRWHSIFPVQPINTDEAVATALSILSLHHPVPWRDFDPTTAGPFEIYTYAAPGWLGIPLSLFSSRIVGLILIFTGFASLYAAAARIYPEMIARLAPLPYLAFFSLQLRTEFIFPGNELPAMTLWCVSLALLTRAYALKFSWVAMLPLGTALGAMPFAKLQTAPLALATMLAALGVLGAGRALPVRRGVAGAVALCFAAALPGTLVVAVTAFGGAFHDMLVSWIFAGLSYRYAEGPPLFEWFVLSHDWTWFFVPIVLVAAAYGFLAWRSPPAGAAQRFAPPVSGALFLVACYSAYAPHRGSANYFLIVVAPAVALAGSAFGSAVCGIALRGAPAGSLRNAAAIFAILTLAPQLAQTGGQIAFSRSYSYWRGSPGGDDVSRDLARFVQPGERVAIWGWRPEMTIYSGTLLGTRDPHTYFAMYDPDPDIRGYFRKRFVADLERNQPAAVVDAAADRSSEFESVAQFTELKAVLDRDYRLAIDNPKERLKIYVRSGRDAVR